MSSDNFEAQEVVMNLRPATSADLTKRIQNLAIAWVQAPTKNLRAYGSLMKLEKINLAFN